MCLIFFFLVSSVDEKMAKSCYNDKIKGKMLDKKLTCDLTVKLVANPCKKLIQEAHIFECLSIDTHFL